MGPLMGGFPRMVFDSNISIVTDGNSLTAGIGGTSWATQIKPLAPLNNLGTVTNVSVNGQTTDNMINTASDVDGAWAAGKKNILIVWEGTNQICNLSQTGLSAAQKLQTYIAARRAAHTWDRVVIVTCLPRQTSNGAQATLDQNVWLDDYNAYLRANWRAMGADALVDVRAPGSPFNIANYAMQTFEDLAASSGLWAASETGNHIHLNDAGYLVIATMIAAALHRLRR